MYSDLGIFRCLLVPYILIVLVHNWLSKDNEVGFEVSPSFKWTYKEDYEKGRHR